MIKTEFPDRMRAIPKDKILIDLLNNQGLALVINDLRQGSRDGMMSCGGLGNQTQITLQSWIHGRFFHSPFTDIAKDFSFSRSLLGGLTGRPTI